MNLTQNQGIKVTLTSPHLPIIHTTMILIFPYDCWPNFEIIFLIIISIPGNNCDSQLIAEQVQARACDFPARPAVVEHVNTEPESYIRQRFRDDNFVPTSGPSDEMVVPQQESLLGGLLTQDPIPVKQTDYFSLALCILAVTSIALLHSGFGMLICNVSSLILPLIHWISFLN